MTIEQCYFEPNQHPQAATNSPNNSWAWPNLAPACLLILLVLLMDWNEIKFTSFDMNLMIFILMKSINFSKSLFLLKCIIFSILYFENFVCVWLPMEVVSRVAEWKISKSTPLDFSFRIFICRIESFVKAFFAWVCNCSGLLCRKFLPTFWLSLKIVGWIARLIEIQVNTIWHQF